MKAIATGSIGFFGSDLVGNPLASTRHLSSLSVLRLICARPTAPLSEKTSR